MVVFRSLALGLLVTFLLAVPAVAAETPAIHEKAALGDTDAVRALLEQNSALAHTVTRQGATPLHMAVAEGHWAVAEVLLEAAPDLLEKGDDRGLSALNLAALCGRTEMITRLLERGAKLATGDNENSRPLHNAAARGHLEAVRLLIDRGADATFQDDNGTTPLHFAASSGVNEMVRLLLSNGADPNARNLTRGMTPLHWAAGADRIETVKLLLSRDADPDVRDLEGRTPLSLALVRGLSRTARWLIENGADIDIADQHGETPLLIALHTDEAIARLLVEAGADLHAGPEGGWTVLHVAAFSGMQAMAELFIEKGIDVDVATARGMTPLWAAIRHGHSPIVELLIAEGANVNVIDDNGDPLLMHAVRYGNRQVVRSLLDAGSEPNASGRIYGRTPLHWAAIDGSREIAAQLLDNGADPDLHDATGKAPMAYACRYAHSEVADLLRERGASSSAASGGTDTCSLLAQEISAGEAALWYLGHCGWAVRTQKHFLIFDYWENGVEPDTPCLANGRIDPEELEGQNVYTFVTHGHGDHFDPAIFWWRRLMPEVTYILGFQPDRRVPAHVYTPPHETQTIGDLEVTTIAANDSGVGFLVEVDGLVIYHAGDHAGWREGEKEGYTREIDFLAKRFKGVDLAFLNITGCHAHNPEALAAGTAYTLATLPAKVMIPTHAGGRENLYREYALKAAEEEWPVEVACPENRGDFFVFRKGHIE